ncbi:MAG: preprotein translocase subunit SecY [Bacteroidetes bacterium]|nr:MAG: preprotein translocase subunit SecY [Bacteroidota bacterium]
MKRIINTITNIFSIEELRNRIVATLGFLLIFRLGSYVVLPGLDSTKLTKNTGGILGLLDTFLGGAFSNASIFALGIMPYISASIVLQLLTIAVPYFQKMQKEGESGRKKINQITRLLTIVVTFFQSIGYVSATIPQDAILIDPVLFKASAILILISGTMFCMWLGERITDRGIGNGISMLIMVGIISRFPGALIAEGMSKGMSGALFFLVELIALFFVVMAVIMLTQATRKIPVQYAKQVVGGQTVGGQRQYIPLKLNTSGVMPIIFAQSLMFLPAMIASIWADQNDLANAIGSTFSNYTSWQYNVVFGILIILFTFFYTAIAVNPEQMSDDVKRNNGFIPGVKPGKPTSDFIDNVISRITLPGALFLVSIAVLPAIASLFGLSREFAQFYGGTSLLIMVGVVLDTLQQIESYLLMKRYDGLMKSGRVKGRVEPVESF